MVGFTHGTGLLSFFFQCACWQEDEETGIVRVQELTNPIRLGIKVLVSISTEADKDQNLGEVDLSVPSAFRPTSRHGSTLDLRDDISQAPCALASLWVGQWEAQGIGQWQDKRRGRGFLPVPHTP